MKHARTLVVASSFLLAAPAFAQQSNGVTSGPASGQPTTLGTGGESPATKHQTETMKNKGGPAVGGEKQGQAGGTSSTVKPGVPDAESGAAPARRNPG